MLCIFDRVKVKKVINVIHTMEMQNDMGGKMVCKCPHHSVVPLCIALIGLVFLLGALGVLTSGVVAIIWPVLLLVAGLTKLSSKRGMCKCCSNTH